MQMLLRCQQTLLSRRRRAGPASRLYTLSTYQFERGQGGHHDVRRHRHVSQRLDLHANDLYAIGMSETNRSVSLSPSLFSLLAARATTTSTASAPPSLLRTRHACHRMEPWGDVCVYENMCYDGDALYYFDESGDERWTGSYHWSCA